MEQAQQIVFGPFRLDPSMERLWRGEQEVALRTKPFAVLRYLAEHPGQVVSKEELLKTVWAGTYVTKTVLKVCIREIRAALGEEVAAPRYIATVGRLGYQFLDERCVERSDATGQTERTDVRRIVGRSHESTQLQRWLTQAERGVRRIVFVTGEPGIGKTALVDLFVNRVQATGQVWIGHGQCVEQYGEGEAYLPVLEAFGQICRAPGGQQVLDILRRYAPTWLAQMPALVSGAEIEVLQRKVQGATRERTLREMAEAIEALTAKRPLILVFEDLHWSDYSTLELLAYLARRRERARLLVIGTYRPTEVIVSSHPLKGVIQELLAHGHCEELRLELLTTGDVADYVTRRFPAERHGHQHSPTEAAPFQALAKVIHRRTDGNPLFMVNLVEHAVNQGLIVEQEGHWQLKGSVEAIEEGVPEGLRQLIARQIERLSVEEQRALEVASVAGTGFAVAAVAAGRKQEAEAVEEICEELAWQGRFLQEEGVEEWPDGTVSGRYQFRHALYQNVLYERIAEVRRVRLHRQIGERKEKAYGTRAREVATELAVHFERGRDYPQAVQYLGCAGDNAIRRSANQEAVSLLTKGLELLKTLPDTPERAQQELTLQVTLSGPLTITKGYAAPEVEKAYIRAWELCRQLEERPKLFRVLSGLAAFYQMRAELQIGREFAEQCLKLAQSIGNSILLGAAYDEVGSALFWLGELTPAREHLEQGITLYDPKQHHPFVSGARQDFGVTCRCFASFVLWLLGYPDQALKRSQEALTLAQEPPYFYSLAYALSMASRLQQLRRERQTAQE
jgi:predicted ATPase/DNA-binding winged helix-turn-helix (wHTH) protein